MPSVYQTSCSSARSFCWLQITWMEKFVRKGGDITAPTPTSHPRPALSRTTSGPALHVGVLHLYPSLEPFPLLDERTT